ncbi:MAG: hypothetical protein ACFB14_08775, partial [Leptolyngbyaceae cyanobacterium]
MANLMRVPQAGAVAINDAVDRMNTLTLFVKQTLRNECGFRKLWPRNEGVIPEIMAILSLNKQWCFVSSAERFFPRFFSSYVC